MERPAPQDRLLGTQHRFGGHDSHHPASRRDFAVGRVVPKRILGGPGSRILPGIPRPHPAVVARTSGHDLHRVRGAAAGMVRGEIALPPASLLRKRRRAPVKGRIDSSPLLPCGSPAGFFLLAGDPFMDL